MSIQLIEEVVVLHVAHTTAEWQGINDIIPKGLLCVEFATGGITRMKVGDGVKKFVQLPYTDGNVDLSQYYTKSQTDNAISAAIMAIGAAVTVKGTAPKLADLPMTGNKQGDMWFVENDSVHTGTGYAEYIWINGAWEFIGKNQSVDLTAYATVTYVDSQITALSSRITSAENSIAAIQTELSSCIKTTDKLILQCIL